MSGNHKLVVFSNKAYNAIIRESFAKDPVETGGILLGHILDNGAWIVMEVLPPGAKSIFRYAYFEYDTDFVNYLAQSVANQYRMPLHLLGLWHRHPGHLDTFSSTDDETNMTFARQLPQGVISGLVNIDPQFRLTMYHMGNPTGGTCNYEKMEVEVGDDIIPTEYFELRYYDGENSDPHPNMPDSSCSPDGGGINPRISSRGSSRGQHYPRWAYVFVAIVVAFLCVKGVKYAVNWFADRAGCHCQCCHNNSANDSVSNKKDKESLSDSWDDLMKKISLVEDWKEWVRKKKEEKEKQQ